MEHLIRHLSRSSTTLYSLWNISSDIRRGLVQLCIRCGRYHSTFSSRISTERSLQKQTEFFFLSFPLLLCLKLVADASPHHGAGTTFHTRPPSCLWPDPKDLIASNTSIDLIKPLGSGHFSTWNELDAILPPPRRRHGKMSSSPVTN